MPVYNHAADYTAFQDFYREELENNPLYRHLAEALKTPAALPEAAYRAAAADLHEFERECFQTAYVRLNALSDGHAADIVSPNDFFFFRTQLGVE